MDYLSTTYGLVTDHDPTSENGQLFLTQLIMLDNTNALVCNQIMLDQLLASKVERGLYHRNPDLTARTMSHDNLTAIFTYSYLNNTSHRFEIWNYLLKHLGTYDNTKNKSTQLSRFLPFNPANFFIWGLCAKSNIYLLFLPFYVLSLILSCNTDRNETSGKILNWIKLKPHKDHWIVKHLFRYYEQKMYDQYVRKFWVEEVAIQAGFLPKVETSYIRELMKIYHGGNSKEFPINKLLGIGV